MRSLVSLDAKKVNPQKLGDQVVEHFSLPAFDEAHRPVLEPASEIKSSKTIVDPQAVLVSKLNPRIPRVWMPGPAGDRQRLASTEFLAVIPSRDVIDRTFLFYLCRSEAVQRPLRASVTGTSSSHQRVNPVDFLEIEVDIPDDVDEQRRIADILYTVDVKLEANREVIGIATATLDAALRESIEDGAESKPLAELVEFENKRRVPLSKRARASRQGIFPYYGATGVLDHLDGYLFDEPRVLVGEDGTVMRPDGRPVVQLVSGKYWVNNHAHVLKPVGISVGLLGALLNQADVRHLVSGSVQPKLNMGNLSLLKLVIPKGDALAAVDDLAEALYEVSEAMQAENAALEAVLSRCIDPLVSGEWAVNELEAAA